MGTVSRNDGSGRQQSSTPGRPPELGSGYESPADDERLFIREPHRMQSSPAALPQHRPNASSTGFVEREDPSPPHASLNDLVLKAKNMRSVGIRDRIACFRWTWFTMTMATGGVANVFASIPSHARWLNVIGLIFFFLNVALFVMNCILITLRFHYRPKTFMASFTDQVESLFTASFVSFC